MNKILIHTCCAPCFVGIYEDLTLKKEIFSSDEEISITSIYYNPNIHPKFEYDRRKNTLIDYCNMVNCDLVILDEYNLPEFAKNVVNLDNKYSCRCEYCYSLRLEKVFKYAKENGYDSVMTTLSISPYQNQEIITKVGNELSKKYLINYIHLDYTKIFRQGQNRARELGLYRQKYCGCVFSMDARKVGVLNGKLF